MSKKNLIAIAVVAALAAPAAFATTVKVGDGVVVANAVTAAAASTEVLPKNAFTGAAVIASNFTRQVAIYADANSVYLGRTTGYNIKLTLSQGVFNGNPTPSLLGATDAASVAGGGDNANTVTIAVTPDATNGVRENDGIFFAPGAISIDGVAALGAGGTVGVTVQVFDPVGGNQLGSNVNATLIQTVEGWVVTYAAPANGDIRIDVGSDSGKTLFSSTGEVNLADTALYNAGSVAVAIESTLTNAMGLDLATATAPISITGADFSAFEDGAIFLATSDACSAAGAIATTINAAGTTATVAATTTAAALNTAKFVCFEADGVTEIAAQDLSGSVRVSQTNFAASPTFTESAKFLDLAYNGANKYVWHFNPASNTDQVSYLRLTNTSTTDGLVTISGICDDGTSTPSVAKIASFAAGKSVLLTSKDVEQGNAGKGVTQGTGACAAGGKVRLTITGEFGSMEVQNFLRNVTSAGMINTNVNNKD